MASSNSKDEKDPKDQEEKQEKQRPEIDVYKHKDPTIGLTVKKLERSFWLFQHKSTFKKTVIIFLVIFSALNWGYVLFYVTMYLAVGMNQDAETMRGLTKRLLPEHEFTKQIAPQNIEVLGMQTFDDKDNFNIVVEIGNPNEWHHAEFDYCFSSGGEDFDCDQDFILPRESKYVLSLGQDRDVGRANINFNIKNENWRKIDRHEILHWENFEEDRLNIEFEEVEFISSRESDLSERVDISVLSFIAFNDTSYGYYRAPLQIFLYRGNNIVGVNRYTVSNFRSQNKTSIELLWPNMDHNVDRVKIVPNINILDPNSYLHPGR